MNESETNREVNEMEEGMIEPSAGLKNIREAFASAQWRRRVKDMVSLVVMIVAAAACVMTLAAPEFLSVGVLAVFGLFAASGASDLYVVVIDLGGVRNTGIRARRRYSPS